MRTRGVGGPDDVAPMRLARQHNTLHMLEAHNIRAFVRTSARARVQASGKSCARLRARANPPIQIGRHAYSLCLATHRDASLGTTSRSIRRRAHFIREKHSHWHGGNSVETLNSF